MNLPKMRFSLGAACLGTLCLAALACNFGGRLPSRPATPTPALIATNCDEATTPTDADIQYALAFTGQNFASKAWERSYSVEAMRVSVVWKNTAEGALAYLEYLVYSCGYTQADLDEYFSPYNIENVILQDYQNPEPLAKCRQVSSQLDLHEYRAVSQNRSYLVRLWDQPVSNTRALYLLLAFPEESRSQLDRAGEAVFPSLSRCSP